MKMFIINININLNFASLFVRITLSRVSVSVHKVAPPWPAAEGKF